jgi:hypothetical protein
LIIIADLGGFGKGAARPTLFLRGIERRLVLICHHDERFSARRDLLLFAEQQIPGAKTRRS